MIFRKIPKPKSIKGSTSDLAKYLTNGKDKDLAIGLSVSAIADYLVSPKGVDKNTALSEISELIHERVGAINISNMEYDDLDLAVKDILLTQRQYDISNNSIGSDSKDHNYHLLMSFPNGERPNDEDLKKMEDRACSELGFSNHQRYSVQHVDTNNFHVHIVINQINPDKLTKHYPKHDYAILNRVATEIEKEYGLEKTNHKIRKDKNILSKIDITESGRSFLNYLKVDVKAAEFISDNKGIKWEHFHSFLNDSGVGIKKQGNGLIFFNLETPDITVKASSVSRELSLKKLENFFNESFSDSNISIDSISKNKADKQLYDKLSKNNKTSLMDGLYKEYLEYKESNSLALKNYYSVLKEERNNMTSRYQEARKYNKGNAYTMLKIDMSKLASKVVSRAGHKPNKTKSFSDFLDEKMKDSNFIKKLNPIDIDKFKDDVSRHKYKTDIFDFTFVKNESGGVNKIPRENSEIYGKVIYYSNKDIIRFNSKNNTYSLSNNLSDIGIDKILKQWSKDVKQGKLIKFKCDDKTLNRIIKTSINEQVFLRFSDHRYNVLIDNKKQEIVKYERARNRRRSKFGRSDRRIGIDGRIKFSPKFSNFDRFIKGGGKANEQSVFDNLFTRRFDDIDGESIVFRRTNRSDGDGTNREQGIKLNIVESNSNATKQPDLSNTTNTNDRLLFMQSSSLAHDRIERSKESKSVDKLLSNHEENHLGSQRQRESERDRDMLWERNGGADDVGGIGRVKFANKQTDKLFNDGIINELKVFLHGCKKNLVGAIDVFFKISKNDVAISRIVIDEKSYNEKLVVNNKELVADTELILSKKSENKFDITVKDLEKEKSIPVITKGRK